MTGWCPIHDRTVRSIDDACPECGTPLVPLPEQASRAGPIAVTDEEPREALAEPEPSQGGRDRERPHGTATLASIALAIVVASFFVGAEVSNRRGSNAKRLATPQASADYSVGAEQSRRDVRLKLESFTQRGRRVIMRVSVPDQRGVDIGRITGVVVAPVIANLISKTYPLDARITTTGFIADGIVLDRPDLPVGGIQIVSLTMRAGDRVTLRPSSVDLSRVWPDRRPAGPIAASTNASLGTTDGRTLRLTGLVGWPDHLEARLEARGRREGWDYADRYVMQVDEAGPAEGAVIPGITSDASSLQVAFKDCIVEPFANCLPRGAPRGVLAVAPVSVTITGYWRWDFTG